MAFHPIAQTAKVEILLHHTLTLVPIANILHAKCSATPTPTEMANMAAAVDTAIGAHLNVWGNQVAYEGVRVTGLNTATDPQALDTASAGNGTGGNNTAAGLACLVRFETAVRSRSSRGRAFIGPCPASDLINDGTSWDPAYLTVVDNLISAIESGLAALTPASDLVVGSRKLGTSQAITSFTAMPAPAYQRRRAGR